MPSPLLNFLNPIFNATVRCDAVADDIYLAENLLAVDRQKFDLGFMAYSVTKPPINLDFQLMCGVNLACIRIWPKVGSLKSTGFEVFVSNQIGSNAEYVKIANCFNLTENGVSFIQSAEESLQKPDGFKLIQCFRSSRAAKVIRRVRICIKQTQRCCPVMKRIEIWGRVAGSESEQMKQNVLDLHHRLNPPANTHSSDDDVEETEDCPDDNDEDVIPEQFLDAITYEIMSLPMVLPSGKTIDNSTLVKHNLQEEKWGRPPSDPFTGVMLTNTRKAILNTQLKSQIDKFLLQNDHLQEIRKTARTVGTITTVHTKRRRSTEATQPLHKLYRSETDLKNIPMDAATSALTSSSSLDDAVKRALSSATRYSTLTSAAARNSDEKCFLCSSTSTAVISVASGSLLNGANCDILYEIKLCGHLICRRCLVDKACSICTCGMKFQNIDITKFNRKLLL